MRNGDRTEAKCMHGTLFTVKKSKRNAHLATDY